MADVRTRAEAAYESYQDLSDTLQLLIGLAVMTLLLAAGLFLIGLAFFGL